MKKKLILMIVCIGLIISGSVVFYYRHTICDKFVEIIAAELDREREKDVGYYTVLNWQNGTFRISHTSSDNRLELIKADNIIVLLEDIYDYKIAHKRLYICAQNGMAVVSEDNFANIYFFGLQDEDYKEYESRTYESNFVFSKSYNDESVTYVDNFEDFQEKDQKVLKKMKID